MNIPIDKIVPNPQQPRKEFDQNELNDLAESIQQHGVINPISVEEAGDHYMLIDGERRWRAAQLARLAEIPADIRPGMNGTGQQQRLVLALVGNLQRSDMNPMDTAEAFQKLRETGKSTAEISYLVNLVPSSILRYLRMLEFPKEVQDLYRSGKLKNETFGQQALMNIKDPELQIKVATIAAKSSYSGPQMAALIKRMKFREQKSSLSRRTAHEHVSYDGHWNMVAQAGNPRIPEDMKKFAMETCQECALYDEASNKMCRDCPAVVLLKKMLGVGNG